MKQFLIENGFPEDLISSLDSLDLLVEYTEATKAYYVNDDVIMTDSEFDMLSDKIKQNYPTVYNWLQTVIYDKDKFVQKTIDGNDFTQEMISLFKIKENNKPSLCWQEIRRFFGNRYQNQPLLLSPKFDGCSLKVTFEKTDNVTSDINERSINERNINERIIKQIITRGGIDVTQLMMSIVSRDIDKYAVDVNQRTLCITGELVIRKDVFKQKYSSEVGGDYENPRNFVAGVLKRKSVETSILNDLDFIPCTDGINPISIRFPLLTQQSFTTNKVINENTSLQEVFSILKSDDIFPYLCDGLVLSHMETDGVRKVKDNYPLNMVAVKFPAPTATTKVLGIDWTQKKSGKLTPRILLEPVKLDGSTVSACSGYNWYQVKSKHLGIGALIEIEKSGDIIPIVKRVIKPSQNIDLPKVNYKVSGKHLIAVNDEETKIFKFISGLRILQLQGIGDTTAEQIGSVLGYDILKCFDTQYKPNIVSVIGSGAVWNSFQEIYNIKNIYLNTLIELMQFDNVGPKISMKVALLLTKQSTDTQNISSDVLSNVCRGEGVKQISENMKYLKTLGINVLKPVKVSDTDLTYEMSGNPPSMTKQEFEKRLKKIYPNAIHTSLTKNTKVLIVDNKASATSKALKARKYNIRIETYEDMLTGNVLF